MHTIASRMKVFEGCQAEYQRRHEALWPELSQLLTDTGIREYSIFLDEETSILFALLKVEDPALLEMLPEHPVMQKWWQYMKDIMETHGDASPVNIPLKTMFEFTS